MAKKQKYYVVWEGLAPGVYDSWTECQLQIKGYPNAKYKSFSSRKLAEDAYNGTSYEENIVRHATKPIINYEKFRHDIIEDSIAVDAACSGNPGIMEYRGVWTTDGVEIFKVGTFQNSTNNVGEFLALVHGLAYLQKLGKPETAIYSDSRTAISWVKKRKIKTKLKPNQANKDSFKLMTRGMKWLYENTYTNPILKWETRKWGEIPADFGRK